MSKLIYCATPSRIVDKTNEIMDFVTNKGYAPLHPFQAFPYERFEGNKKIGREKTIEYCLKLIDISDEFWMFGVSEGTLKEVRYAIKTKPVFLKFDFDHEWKRFYEKLKDKYKDVLDSFLLEQNII